LRRRTGRPEQRKGSDEDHCFGIHLSSPNRKVRCRTGYSSRHDRISFPELRHPVSIEND
jgi:hypothetical protein